MTRSPLRRTAGPRAMVALVVACIALACATLACAAEEPARHFDYVIPKGTAGLIATNRAPEIFPPNLVVHVGDSITIVNEDDFDQEVGPYRVKANSKISQHFSSPGVLEGACTMSMGGTLKVTVLSKD